ncbi:VRR-NUC domain-containing protein [Shewanella algae]|uniref:VRR-NUC domain-containing protein n=1 Tax=Shewanella algae TaxID=38313 RepID=UPI0030071CE7
MAETLAAKTLVKPATLELVSDYYLSNFELLLEGSRRYLDILPSELARLRAAYLACTKPSRMLLVRLLSRKGEWFRTDRLNYPEIGGLEPAIKGLEQAELISTSSLPNTETWLKGVTLTELRRALLKQQQSRASEGENSLGGLVDIALHLGKSVNGASKETLKRTLLALGPQDSQLLIGELNSELGIEWIELKCQRLLDGLLLLYFGNRYQDLSQFVLSDLGLQRFEVTVLDKAHRAYDSPEQLNAALAFGHMSQQIEEAILAKQPLDIPLLLEQLNAISAMPEANPLLERRRQKLLTLIGREAERQGQTTLAISVYSQCEHWLARERLCRCLEKQAQWRALTHALLHLCDLAGNESQWQIIERIGKRLLKKLPNGKDSKFASPSGHSEAPDSLALDSLMLRLQALKENVPGRLGALPAIALQLTPNGERVEMRVAAHFEALGYRAFFLENALLCGLFGLAFWDIIFAPVKAVFDNPFQRSPRDMFTEEFVSRRQEAITARLDEIAREPGAVIWRHFQQKQGLANDWVYWENLPQQALELTLAALSGARLAQVFERMLGDLKHYRSGHPDLVLFDAEGRISWLEVKGPGDKLADHQIYWLNFLSDLGEARVCYVDWATAGECK